MPAVLLADLLGIACEFSDGRRGRWLLDGAGDPALVADLLAGLAGRVHPHGKVDAPGTVESYLIGLRDIAGFMTARGVRGGATALTRAVLAEYWMQAGGRRESTTRLMLAGYDTATGALDAGVRALVDGRHYTPRPSSDPLVPYDQQQWAQLQDTCRRIAGDAFAGHRRALAAAAAGHDPQQAGWNGDNLRWLLVQHGPLSTLQVAAHLGVSDVWVQQHGGVRTAFAGLFPDAGVVNAYRVLFGSYCGVVPDGIADLDIGDVDWAGDATILLGYVKGRTAAESVTLPRRAVRLLEQWLEHSALARSHAPAELAGVLWLHCSGRSNTRWQTTIHSGAQGGWGKKHGIEVDRRRIRTTFASVRDRQAWHGSPRSLIDPNHSPGTEADHYLTAATPAQQDAVETIIEHAQGDMARRAQPPRVVTAGQLAELAGQLPETIAALGLDEPAAAELVSGGQDVFTAACTDPTSGLHGPPGKPCPARPWVCLLCPLAIFAPRHAGNLLRLKAWFARHWAGMPAGQFMATFGPYAARVDEVLQHYPALVLAAAAAGLHDDDNDHALPLRPEENTS
jgi:hypothetical protein